MTPPEPWYVAIAALIRYIAQSLFNSGNHNFQNTLSALHNTLAIQREEIDRLAQRMATLEQRLNEEERRNNDLHLTITTLKQQLITTKSESLI